MAYQFPPATAEALADLRRIGKQLDHLADVALSDEAHSLYRASAIKCWAAIDRFEELALLVEEMATALPAGQQMH